MLAQTFGPPSGTVHGMRARPKTPPAPDKRPYLRAEQRRQHLLDAAGRLFERDGLTGITMVALAAEAGVSRRLIYDHFDSLASLYTAFFLDRMAQFLETSEARLAAVRPDAPSMSAEIFRLLITLPPDNLRAVRLLMADTANHDLDQARAQLRTHLAARWLPLFREAVGEDLAMAVVWTVMTAQLALADIVISGQLDAATATRLAAGLTRALPGVIGETLAPAAGVDGA